MPREFVKTGVWELYSEPFHKRWVWTLEDGDAFWLLGIYIFILAFVQQRAWSILRYYIARWKSPIGFEDRVNPLLKLSQTTAVRESITHFQMIGPRYLRKLTRSTSKSLNQNSLSELETEETLDDGAIPWLFGLLALVNGVGFIVTGILLPLLLTNGIEAPLVRSRWTPLCDKRRFDAGSYIYPDSESHGSGLYDLCWDHDNFSLFDKAECSSSAIEGLKITFRNSSDCPFPRDICFADGILPRVLTIKHHNITLRQLGLNSRSKMSINYEISCSPLQLEHFIRPLPGGGSVLSFLDFKPEDIPDYPNRGDPYSLKLNTLNGPNKWTAESSGTLIALSNTSQSTGESFAFPSDEYYEPFLPNGSVSRMKKPPLHSMIRDDNAKFFAIVYRAGPRTYYLNPVHDPVFMAHVFLGLETDSPEAHPDYEAAAIGCMEKFQFCPNIPGGLQCGTWGGWWDRAKNIDALFPLDHQLDDRWEAVFTVKQISQGLSLYMDQAPLTRTFPKRDRSEILDLWAGQILPLYLQNWWGVLHRIQRVATGTDTSTVSWPPPGYSGDMTSFQNEEEANRWSWCHRVLLKGPDYTNINFFGFMISLVMISLVCVFSYGDRLRSLWSQAMWLLPYSLVEGLNYLWRLLMSMFRLFRRRDIPVSDSAEYASYSMGTIQPQIHGFGGNFNYHEGTIPGPAAVHLQTSAVGNFYEYDDPLPMAPRGRPMR